MSHNCLSLEGPALGGEGSDLGMSSTCEWAPPASVSPVGEGLGVFPVELCVLRAVGPALAFQLL